MDPKEIIIKIEQATNLLKQFKDKSVTIVKIELGSETYKDFCLYMTEQQLPSNITFDVTSYMGIPIQKIDYFEGVYFKIQIN